jgi:arginine-tRNA-protein transferase
MNNLIGEIDPWRYAGLRFIGSHTLKFMRHSPTITPQFYVTAPTPCPYLEGRVERKLFTSLNGDNAQQINDVLSHQGFRRSQNVLYRPSCADCNMCLSVRIRVDDFKPSTSQKRVLKKNASLLREGNAPWATEDQYALFRRYVSGRHNEGGMADMDVYEYAAMVEETQVRSRVVEYSAPDEDGRPELRAVCLTDVLSDGLSMVYSFFDPDHSDCSLGTYLVLDHIKIAQNAGLPYVYLGYWVPGSRKMDYKKRFKPLELFFGGKWQELDAATQARKERESLRQSPALDEDGITIPDVSDLT